MARVLVTGAAGFIGSHTSEALVSRGDEVVGVDNFDEFYSPWIKRANIERVARNPRFTFEERDFREMGCAELREFDVVVHLAARAGVRASFSDPTLYRNLNATGTSVFGRNAVEAGIPRFVLGSSSSVYGNANRPTGEDAELCPLSPYASSKVEAENACRLLAGEGGMEVLALRFFSVFGPRQRPDQAASKFLRLLVDGESLEFYGDGSSKRDYTFVGDVAAAIVLAAHCETNTHRKYRVFNVGTGAPMALSSLAKRLAKGAGVELRIRYGDPKPGDADGTWAKTSRIRQEMGWVPKVSMETGLSIFINWYKKHYGYTTPAIS